MKSKIMGFVLSIALTFTAYLLCVLHINSEHKTPPDSIVVPFIVGLALIQIIVQLVFFLHLDAKKSRANAQMLGAAVIVILILVSGFIWIMNNLDHNMMSDHENTDSYIIHDEGLDAAHEK